MKSVLRRFFTNNVNSLLGAISLHLMVVIAFLGFKLGEMNEVKKEQILIEFNEEILLQEEDKKPAELSGEEIGEPLQLDQRTLHSIASNVASKLESEISTSSYEQQVLNELGIATLKSPGGDLEKQAQQKLDENAIEEKQNAEKQDETEVPNIIRKDNTTVSYFLEGRWHKYIYIPTYKCQGGGTVTMDIIINQEGRVVTATISDNKSTADPCLREEAFRSATSARFNSDSKASAKQLGTMTYVFVAQ